MSTRGTLLLLGGGYADLPLLRAAQRLGFRVVTTGNRPGDPCHGLSDLYIPADFSDPEAMFSAAAAAGATAVCAGCNDFAALSATYVASRLGLPGHDPLEVAQTLHHKDRYRNFARQYGIPAPRAAGYEDPTAAMRDIGRFTFPILVKPVDLTGGKGISVVAQPGAAASALDKAFAISRAKRVVVEEFVTGSRHGFSAFLRDGRVVFHFSDDEHYYLNPFMVSAASAPTSAPPSAEAALIARAEQIADILRLGTGIFHVQYILHDGQPIIIEICRRAPGDLYLRLVELATGVDYAGLIVKAATGLASDEALPRAVRGFFTRHCVMAPRPGRVEAVDLAPEIRGNIKEGVMWWTPGDTIADAMTQKLGIMFLSFSSAAEMLDKTARMPNLIKVSVR